MVKKEDISKGIHEKVLFVGESASGKTYNAVRIALLAAESGKKVIFIEPEDGCRKELERYLNDYGQEVFDNLDLVDSRVNYEEFHEAIFGLDDEKYDMVVVDSFDELFHMGIDFLENKYINIGKYEIMGKEFKITDKDSFVLPYQKYPRLYSDLIKALYKLLRVRSDFIVTMKEIGRSDAKQEAMERCRAKFDTVVELRRGVKSAEGGEVADWYGVVKKNRGREKETSNLRIQDVSKSLEKRFRA